MANISKRGDKWRAEVCIDRKRESKTFPTKKEAVAWANEKEQTGLSSRKTLKDAISKYRIIAEAHRGSQSELSRLRHLERSSLGSVLLDRISPAKLSEYRDDRLNKVGPSSVRREFIILSALFNVAHHEWGWMASNPLATVRKPSPNKPRMRGISQAEIDAICANLAKKRTGAQIQAMFLLALETGMRMSEILSIRWDDVTEKTVLLRRTKNGDSRIVPLSHTAREVISSRTGLHPETIFTLTTPAASKAFQRVSVNGVHFHDSRSEAITRLSKKLDVMQLAKMIGHRDLKSLMIYYAEKPEDIADQL